MKPIAVIAPSLEKGLITAGSVVDDVPISRYNGKLTNWYVKGNSGYKGLSNIRYMLRISQNTTEAQLLEKLTPIKSIEFLRELGITTLVTSDENKKANDENLSLALGGVTYGISPLEMAAAYATIANDGEYIEPTFYSKVVDSKNNVILEPNQEKRRVISEENAFILIILTMVLVLLQKYQVCKHVVKQVQQMIVSMDGSVALHHIILVQHGLVMIIMLRLLQVHLQQFGLQL